jgi:hypothetical protein
MSPLAVEVHPLAGDEGEAAKACCGERNETEVRRNNR